MCFENRQQSRILSVWPLYIASHSQFDNTMNQSDTHGTSQFSSTMFHIYTFCSYISRMWMDEHKKSRMLQLFLDESSSPKSNILMDGRVMNHADPQSFARCSDRLRLFWAESRSLSLTPKLKVWQHHTSISTISFLSLGSLARCGFSVRVCQTRTCKWKKERWWESVLITWEQCCHLPKSIFMGGKKWFLQQKSPPFYLRDQFTQNFDVFSEFYFLRIFFFCLLFPEFSL